MGVNAIKVRIRIKDLEWSRRQPRHPHRPIGRIQSPSQSRFPRIMVRFRVQKNCIRGSVLGWKPNPNPNPNPNWKCPPLEAVNLKRASQKQTPAPHSLGSFHCHVSKLAVGSACWRLALCLGRCHLPVRRAHDWCIGCRSRFSQAHCERVPASRMMFQPSWPARWPPQG